MFPNLAGRTDFPKSEVQAHCLSDGIEVDINFSNSTEADGFDGVLYVKGHSKEEECRRIISLDRGVTNHHLTFKVRFGSCGLIHVNVSPNEL